MSINLQELRGFISNMYSDVANFPRGDFHFPIGRPIMEALGYESEKLDRIPATAIESFAGVGYHFGLAPLQEGERVLDLGAGAGSDAFYASLFVGPSGKVVGLDMTEAMHDKSERNRGGSFDNVEFVSGHVEEPPFEDESFDVVISNGVINLSPEKDRVFSEIRRLLKPGGRLVFSDIITGVELPQSVRDNCELWAECIGGAVQETRYVKLIEAAGFRVETVKTNEGYAFTKDSTVNAAKKFQVRSISILAYKT